MNFGAELRKVRKARGMTQAELAKAMGCSRYTIMRYETNKVSPKNPSAVYEGLGRILEVDPRIFTVEEETNHSSYLPLRFSSRRKTIL